MWGLRETTGSIAVSQDEPGRSGQQIPPRTLGTASHHLGFEPEVNGESEIWWIEA